MTAQAERRLDERHAFAAPGGAHDRLIGLLARVLPAAVGVLAALMVLLPLSPRGEVSFLLDRRKVAITAARIAVDQATYRGADDHGRPFNVTAGHAVQQTPAVPVVRMQSLAAQLRMSDGDARVTAPTADYNYQTQKVSSREALEFTAADGYHMTMNNVDIDLNTRKAVGGGGVSGAGPAGQFTADRVDADLGARTVALDGHARLRMVPGRKFSLKPAQ